MMRSTSAFLRRSRTRGVRKISKLITAASSRPPGSVVWSEGAELGQGRTCGRSGGRCSSRAMSCRCSWAPAQKGSRRLSFSTIRRQPSHGGAEHKAGGAHHSMGVYVSSRPEGRFRTRNVVHITAAAGISRRPPRPRQSLGGRAPHNTWRWGAAGRRAPGGGSGSGARARRGRAWRGAPGRWG